MNTEELIARGLPEHVAIIMDGNGRWAKKRGLIRTAGHKEGLNTAKKIVAAASKLGIKYITLYVFSTENWKRTQEEVGFIMNLIKGLFRAEFEFYKKNKIRIQHLGRMDGLPDFVKEEIIKTKKSTETFTGTTCVLALNYGGRDEILRAVQKLVSKGLSADSITEDLITQSMDVPDLPPVDLMIRTGGEERLSNFLLWQCAYAEFIFTDTLWPDYNENEFFEDISKYQQRNRRFGDVPNA
ncbi:MAG: di-trans,poly-cis-decaprenylcistransferase [Treponema sp.]|nr:di-trans,poly-cis-decaprenylcistransferase [Treponema sp.]